MATTKRSRDSLAGGTRVNAFSVDPDNVIIKGPEPDPATGKPHHLYDPHSPTELNEDLIRNIMVCGVIQTIILVKEGDEVIVDDGRQRVLCTREANRRLRAAGLPPIMVPAIQKRGTPAKLHGLMVSANEFRYAVSTIERAEKAQRLIDMGQSEEEAGVALGVTVQAIKNWLKLLEVIPAGRKAVESGHASASAIAKLAGKPREEQQKAIEKIVAASTETGKKATARSVTKATGGTVAPAKRFIKKIADAIQTKDPKASAILGWILGELDNKEICERVPAMANAMETASAAKPVKVKQSKAKKAA